MLGDTCGEAARLRTDLQRAEDKLEAEADYAAELSGQIHALYDTTKVTFSDLHVWSTLVPMTASSSRVATIANHSHTLAQLSMSCC